MQLGIIGLGRMGGSLALQAVEKGVEVVAHSKHSHPDFATRGIHIADTYEEFARLLRTPRIIYLSLPAGQIIDQVIESLIPHLERGDVLMDGGNSFFRDSVAREEALRKKGFRLLDCGTSGGVDGARTGACFMVGGSREGFELAEPVLKKLAVDGGVLYTGSPGSGHYAKLVHNGIEFGMNHAIGEGVELLRHGEYQFDLEKVFENWSHGSVIRGWLVELMAKGLREQNFDSIPTYVEDTGEVNWLVQYAIEREIAVPIISASVMSLFASRGSGQDSNRAVALLRHGYGHHPLGKDEAIARERHTSRLSKM
ncbi:phosphogluconate dehydrogenase (NAD(+)-dependent, decarboxylating) [Methanocella arvoryzae]|uniref:6-phosphogluconate dehydrogenase n=1 Tax=Methanocella arvoryzae (strain DSM 22066 / NBRC 105507 / MRE50) TaxID=351160 RepID=Q0W2D7_METAR|nr:putative 6-phosphogluconate dehydrogenase [Methanocella arvoryzae MRE50]